MYGVLTVVLLTYADFELFEASLIWISAEPDGSPTGYLAQYRDFLPPVDPKVPKSQPHADACVRAAVCTYFNCFFLKTAKPQYL